MNPADPRVIKAGDPRAEEIIKNIQGARFVDFDAGALRRPSPLMSAEQVPSFFSSRGAGLPGIYDHIQSRGDDAFSNIRDRVRSLFPAVKSIRVPAVDQGSKRIAVELISGEIVDSDAISEGLLYYLAFAALEYLEPVSCLLIEEPENGLHPARISEVVRVLRKISERGTQVLMATHSPLLINELKPDEVSVVTRTEAGTQVTPISKTHNFEERHKAFELGELWVSYADGKLEAPLPNGRTPQGELR